VAPLVDLRRPTDADHDFVVRRIDDWAGGRKARHLLARLWFRHFSGLSWVGTREDGRVVGIAIGFLGQDDPSVAVLHLVAVDPAHRRRGTGTDLVTAVMRDAAGRGARTIRTTAWPDDRPSIAFLQAVGFGLVEPPDGQRLYGMPALADYDEPGDDRTELERELDPTTSR
jgi:ribosomal protein S18 acetylase RimI-like enzyme